MPAKTPKAPAKTRSSKQSGDLPKKRAVKARPGKSSAVKTGAPAVSVDPAIGKAYAKALADAALYGEHEGFVGTARSAAADFVADTARLRRAGEPAIAIETLPASSGRRTMRVAIVNDDMPFLVDSIAATVAAQGLNVDRILHPVMKVVRDAGGAIARIGKDGERESVIYLEVDRADAKERGRLRERLIETLADVRAAVSDWEAMRAALRVDSERAGAMKEGEEGRALLDWFIDGKLTQLGYETRTRAGAQGDALGICRNSPVPLLSKETIASAFAWFERGGRVPLIVKSSKQSTVHRRVLVDLIIVPVMAGKTVKALSIHAGLWTSQALSAPPASVPVLRRETRALMDKFGFDPAGHAGKALVHALTALPHDLVVSFDAGSLERLALTAMSLSDRPRAKIVTVCEALGRHLYAFVWLPRDEVSTDRRVAVEAMIEKETNASVIGWTMALEDGAPALIRFALDMRHGGRMPDDDRLDSMLQAMVRGWGPEVESELARHIEDGRAAALARRYADTFPAAYRLNYGAAEAAQDILRLRDIGDTQSRPVRLYRADADTGATVRLKAYSTGATLVLSDIVPVLENFGFRVIEELPTALDDGAAGHISDFLLEGSAGSDGAALIAQHAVLEGAIEAVMNGTAENDSFNQLIAGAGLDPQSVVWLRAWFRYLRQAGLTYGMDTAVTAMRNAPAITKGLIGLFRALHQPGANDERAVNEHRQAIEQGLAEVSAIDDDRILRTIWAVIEATLRTNAFAPAAAEALAFKIDSAKVPGLPKPLPWREIWVYSPRVEGIHLRAGPVARGGLRWSDRRDDFRTEILGLMKAQRVKNAVIVPTGAKGGFFPKQLPNPQIDRDAWFAEGKESYRVFIRTLLSITDNIVDGKVVHPDGVTVLDGADPYFVVAADKGTATFSDVANALAAERDFWLGDAFASGGSYGYDHKGMGITARGAWISVQRHFAEMGIDVQTDPVRVAGCGDMSGDVFGNGMLLSQSIKLVAAFDHRHIFFDPDPADPARSWAERERMFKLPRSSWEDYDPKLISKGGGVFSRAEKSIRLTPEIQALLGVSESQMEPAAIIWAILQAEVDLLWFGGIGTYIKAAAQANVEVGDPINDRLRVDAHMVRAKVIGEGANLGVTQAGRVAYADAGGRLNTDFIDNSAGVDCSDNEVNIKIALNREVNEGRLKLKARNELLVRMTDDVSELVLADNRLQALGLSMAERGGVQALPSYVRLMDIFELNGKLDRKVEGLASSEELLRRGNDGQGLTRPELAVLLSTAKIELKDQIANSRLADDPLMDDELLAAFPPEMRRKFGKAILNHQLRREIIATKVANRMINRLGLVHPFELAEEEGCSLAEIATMFVIAERLFDMPALWHRLDTATIDETTRLTLFSQAAAALGSQMADMSRITGAGTSAAATVKRLKKGVGQIVTRVDKLLSDAGRRNADLIAAKFGDIGADAALVEPVLRLFKTDGAIGLADLAQRKGVDEVAATHAFTRLGAALGLDWAQTAAARMSPSDPWERLLVNSLARDFQHMRLDFLSRMDGDLVAAVDDWLTRNAERATQFAQIVDRARHAPNPAGVMLAQIGGQARGLLAQS